MVMGRYMRLWVYAICCRYQTGLYTSCGVWNTGGSTSITTTLTPTITDGELLENTDQQVQWVSHINVQQRHMWKYKLLFCQDNFSMAVLDVLMSKLFQKFKIGDFYFYITWYSTGYIQEISQLKSSMGHLFPQIWMNFWKVLNGL